MSPGFAPERQAARIRSGRVVSVSGRTATVAVDGAQVTAPVHGTAVPGMGAMLIEQGGSLLVMPAPPMMAAGSAVAATNTFGDLGIAYGQTFPSTPSSVFACVGDLVPGQIGYAVVRGWSATAMDLRVFYRDGSAVSDAQVRINWWAVLMPTTAAQQLLEEEH